MRGTITDLDNEIQLKEGETNGRKWTLYTKNIMIDMTNYSISGFTKSAVENSIKHLTKGDIVEFESEDYKGYMRIKKETKIKKLGTDTDIAKETKQETIKQKEEVKVSYKTNIELVQEATQLAKHLLKGIKEDPELIIKARISCFIALGQEQRATKLQVNKEKNMSGWKK